MARRPKIALYWCSSCGGCEESVLDLAEDLIPLSEDAEIVFWPIALDVKYRDVFALKDGEIAVTLLNGAIRMEEQESMARLLRQKSRFLMAHGSCACFGGVYALSNMYGRQEVLDAAYRDAVTVQNPKGKIPQTRAGPSHRGLELSKFHSQVKALSQVVDVDGFIPGCPPTPEQMRETFSMILEDRLLAGAVVAEQKALCETCPRRDSLPAALDVDRFRRLYETVWDPTRCFLDQKIICLGPATRGGCGSRCINGNMPCRGCFGPVENVSDQGAKSVSFIGSLVAPRSEAAYAAVADSIPDPAGLFYRYTMAVSILKGKWGGKPP